MKTAVKLVRKAFAKSPRNIKEMNKQQPQTSTMSVQSDAEMKALKDQLENVKAVVNNLQGDLETKEMSVAKLAREKEKLSADLLKLRRANAGIVKQLEDERKFYFEEKEIYCQEMNEYKELKKSLSISNASNDYNKTDLELKKDLEETKKQLRETLEANYNLSIKFLRIKNTKTLLRGELTRLQTEHEKIINDLTGKIQMMSEEISEIVDQKFNVIPISPSNKKYLELVRQNSSLVYENLSLQLEIDHLNMQFDRVRLQHTKNEINNKLKYMHTIKNKAEDDNKSSKQQDKKKVRIIDEKRGKLEKSKKKCKKSLSADAVKTSKSTEYVDANKSQETITKLKKLKLPAKPVEKTTSMSELSDTKSGVRNELYSKSVPEIVQNS